MLHTTGTSGLVISVAGHKDMRWVTVEGRNPATIGVGPQSEGLLSSPAKSDSCVLSVSSCTVFPEP